MTGARIRLAVTAALFVGWLGYLGFLAARHARPVVLSKAQLAEATCAVRAEVRAGEGGRPDPQVVIKEVFGNTPDAQLLRERQKFVAPPAAELVVGPFLGGLRTELVGNLEDARLLNGRDFPGTGEYLLPLTRRAGGYWLAPMPRSPGYEVPPRPLIYPWTPDIEHQLHALWPAANVPG